MSFSYKIFKRDSPSSKELKAQLEQLLPFRLRNLALYQAALTHTSAVGEEREVNNERLEFLGDAYLGSIVGEMLYLKYSKKDEGFLTEMRSKIVSRHNLNQLAVDIGLDKLVRYNKGDVVLRNSNIFGNALEALIGAIYLDKGFTITKHFILNTLLKSNMDLDELEQTETNFKKGLYQWAQKGNKTVEFNVISEERMGRRRMFKVGIFIDGELLVEGTGWNKKEASQKAAAHALEVISPIEDEEVK